jgi:hypothetical protein
VAGLTRTRILHGRGEEAMGRADQKYAVEEVGGAITVYYRCVSNLNV